MTAEVNIYEVDLPANAANFVPLSPLSFLPRAASLYPERLAWIDGDDECSWADFFTRCRRVSSALAQCGIGSGDTVAALLPNCPEMLEAHFAVPACGAVLNTINTRLDPDAIAFILEHAEAKVLFVDESLLQLAIKALDKLSGPPPLLVHVTTQDKSPSAELTYQDLLDQGDPAAPWQGPSDEWDAIALNYTSGTTGDPKGVVVHHRGAYLNAINNVLGAEMSTHPVYLWTLPMFHCNGWCFPWTLALLGGTSVCLRQVDPDQILLLLDRYGVTHMCGAPIVYQMLLNAQPERTSREGVKVTGLLGGAAPPSALIEGCERLGIEVVHVYGLTEVYGPASLCIPQLEWSGKPLDERASLYARQGVSSCLQEAMAVLDPATMEPVPMDGTTVGEIFFRGNIVMKGYLKNPESTQKAFEGGWFHTGDLAVTDPDGYARIVDRSKDVIISGGENISSLEVEDALYRHPEVMFAAVVAQPDHKWGEVPCAFIEPKPNSALQEDAVIEFCRSQLAHFKAPKSVVFGEIPKTPTGKIQKYLLRKRAAELRPAQE